MSSAGSPSAVATLLAALGGLRVHDASPLRGLLLDERAT